MKYQAQGVFKTPTQGKFNPAELVVEVEVENGELTTDSQSSLYSHIKQGTVDGFEIDLGDNEKLHMIKS